MSSEVRQRKVSSPAQQQQATPAPKTLAQKFWNLLESAISVAVAFFVAAKVDFVDVSLRDPRIERFYWNIGTILFAVSCVIAFSTVIWLKYVKRTDVDDWEKHLPYSVPVATVLGCFCTLFYLISYWTVYGFWTPLILACLFWGLLNVFVIVPGPWS
eukprot:c1124_g1_i1.p1 GENE.c1124_g1_i1~~c1124_g1_i1.p1  ORF type:complete len:157 (-),score=9.81 c1124_g1_i1:27-497(-)